MEFKVLNVEEKEYLLEELESTLHKVNDCINSINKDDIDNIQLGFIKSIGIYETDMDDLLEELNSTKHKIKDCIENINTNGHIDSIQNSFINDLNLVL